MRAAVVEELQKPLVVRSIPDPECPPDGAIVRIGANGIAVDPSPHARDAARKLGAAIVIDSREANPVDAEISQKGCASG